MAQPLVILKGKVTAFKGNGRKLGYPTANIRVAAVARDGVYAGKAWLDGFENHPAMVFIGTPTTVGDTERRVEAHLLDIPDKDYYGKDLRIELEYYLRPNKTFGSLEELVKAMKEDESAVRRWYA
jgi:riboflavin kinase / FMN adenylyltransferase